MTVTDNETYEICGECVSKAPVTGTVTLMGLNSRAKLFRESEAIFVVGPGEKTYAMEAMVLKNLTMEGLPLDC